MSKRIALIIANNTYQDQYLSQLKRPEADIHGLASVLHDPTIGNFHQVETVVNAPSQEIHQLIGELFNWKKRHDMLLLYFLGYTILDEAEQLYLATVDTRLDSLPETSVPATYITGCMDDSFSRRQILILDSYQSRLVPSGSEKELGSMVGVGEAFRGRGYGRVVLATSDVVQFALTGEKILGEVEDSVFTHYLVQGLRTGSADYDEDGQVDVRELYNYVLPQVEQVANQRPHLWSHNERNKFIIARNPSVQQREPIKWDLIAGAIMAPAATIIIGATASLGTSVGMAGLLLLIYAFLYWALD